MKTAWLLIPLAFAGSSIRAVPTLRLVKPAIHQIEDGPPVPSGTSFVAGETVYFSCQIEGYLVSSDEQVKLSYRMDAFDPQGVKIIPDVESNIDTKISSEDKKWRPKIRHDVAIPPLAPSGTYRIAIHVTDDLSHQTAQAEASFLVRGHEIPPAAELTIRDFAFYRTEDDPQPLSTPVYRPGDPLWARFVIIGYKFGERNSIDVTYGVTVFAGGKPIYSQPEAAAEKSFSFYPKPYVPGAMSLSLQRNMRPGEYTIAIAVRDAIGKQTYETRQTFRVE